MRKFTFNRKTIYITEKEWRALLSRWDASKAKKSTLGTHGRFMIERNCAFAHICMRCGECPLGVFEVPEARGCVKLIKGLIRKYGNSGDFHHLSVYVYSIEWFASEDKQARRAIQAIRKGILSAVRVKKRGGCNP